MHVEVAGRSDVGRVRSVNEDRYAIQQDLPGDTVLCILADGMGGHASGDVAATIAVERALEAIGAGGDVGHAVAAANTAVHQRSASEPSSQGMGTTLICALLPDGTVRYAHVGDSRLYLVRDGALRQLTHDHSWVAEQLAAGTLTAEEAHTSNMRNLVTRALGFAPTVDADEGVCALGSGDAVLLCTDGVYGQVSEAELLEACSQPAEQAAEQLVALANAHGGPDNATAVVARLLGSDGSGRGRSAVTRPLPDLDQPPRPAPVIASLTTAPAPLPHVGVPAPNAHRLARRLAPIYVLLALLVAAAVAALLYVLLTTHAFD